MSFDNRNEARGTVRPDGSDDAHWVTVPPIENAEERFYQGESDPIDEFVLHHEPPKACDCAQFRDELQAALDHAYALGLSAAERHPNRAGLTGTPREG